MDGEVKRYPLLHGGLNEPDHHDNATIALKGVVVSDHYDWEDDAPPRTPWGNTVIYEAHVKGLTYLHPELPEEIRGTYKALGHPVMIDYFKRSALPRWSCCRWRILPANHGFNGWGCRTIGATTR